MGSIVIPASTATLEDRLTAARATLLDHLDAIAASVPADTVTQARVEALDALLSTAMLRSGTTSAPIVRPDLANPIVVNTGAAWAYGAWSEFVAAGALAASLLGIIVSAVGQEDEYQVQVGYGAAGSEVVAATFGFRTITGGAQLVIPLPIPVQIPATPRIASRVASKLGTASATYKLWLIPRPFA